MGESISQNILERVLNEKKAFRKIHASRLPTKVVLGLAEMEDLKRYYGLVKEECRYLSGYDKFHYSISYKIMEFEVIPISLSSYLELV